MVSEFKLNSYIKVKKFSFIKFINYYVVVNRFFEYIMFYSINIT